MGETEHKVVFR